MQQFEGKIITSLPIETLLGELNSQIKVLSDRDLEPEEKEFLLDVIRA